MLVQTWPGSFCSDGCCILPNENQFFEEGFSIHGYWPQYGGNTYPACCSNPWNDTYVLDLIQKDDQLRQDIANYWPSMKKCNFVLYEWSKHGTCAQFYNGPSGPSDYIKTTINLRRKVNFWKVLTDNGVVADGRTKYDREWLRDISEKAYGARGFFSCKNGAVSEFRMCTKVTESNKMDPEFFDCPDDLVMTGHCGASLYFQKFPTITAKGPCDY